MLVKKEIVEMVGCVSRDDVEQYIEQNFNFETSLKIKIENLGVEAIVSVEDENPLYFSEYNPHIFDFGIFGEHLSDGWLVGKDGKEVNMRELLAEQDDYESGTEFLSRWFKNNDYLFAGLHIGQHSSFSIEMLGSINEIVTNDKINAFLYFKKDDLLFVRAEQKLTKKFLEAETKLWKGLCDELEAWLNGNLYYISLETRNAYEANHYTSISEGAEWLANGFNDAFADE